MKKYLVLLLLASACNRDPELPKGPVRAELSSLAERPRPDEGVMLSDGSAPTTPPTPQQRADYRAQIALYAQRLDDAAGEASGATESTDQPLDSAYTVVSCPSRERFTRRVNEHLNGGYFLRGPMRTERTGPASFVYLQDMVRHRTQ